MFMRNTIMAFVSRKGGFTLLEILIAIVILGTVLTTVYAAYTGTLRIFKETDYDDQIYSMARTTMKRLIDDVGSVCKYGDKFIFTSEYMETGNTDLMNLAFLAQSHISFAKDLTGGLAKIIYYLEKDSQEKGYVLMRKDVFYSGDENEPAEKTNGFILCKRVKSLSYKFYDGKGNEYESWDSDSGDHKDKAPSVVSISIAFLDPDNENHVYPFMTNVFIPMVTSE